MDEEIKASYMDKNDTWELTTLSKGKHVIRVNGVYKVIKNAKGKVEIIVNGYMCWYLLWWTICSCCSAGDHQIDSFHLLPNMDEESIK